MWGGKSCVVAISTPYVMSVVPVASRTSETTLSGNDDGLKMWARRPSLFQRRNSLAQYPSATRRNCRGNHSGRNQRNRLMLKTIGSGPKPSVWRSRRDHASSASSA